MHIRVLIITLLVSLTMYAASAQDELSVYRNIYHVADSMTKSGATGVIAPGTFTTAATLDKQPPVAYFNRATDLIQESKFNDAAFIYYLGCMRYQYYNSSNPNYKASEDGALYASMKSVLGEPLGMYLRTSADNYIAVLSAAVQYYRKNDYTFYPGTKDKAKYDLQAIKMEELIADMKKNKAGYVKRWLAERKELEKMLSEAGKANK